MGEKKKYKAKDHKTPDQKLQNTKTNMTNKCVQVQLKSFKNKNQRYINKYKKMNIINIDLG